MEKIQTNNVNLNITQKRKTQKNFEPICVENKNENKNIKNTPNNPEFWQNTLGLKNKAISFKGSFKTKEEKIAGYQETLENCKKQMSDISEENLNSLSNVLNKIFSPYEYKTEKYLNIFNVIMQKEDISLEDKLFWMDINLDDPHLRLSDGSENPFFSNFGEKFDIETKLFEFYKKEDRESLIKADLTAEQSTQLLSLFENKNIEQNDLTRITSYALSWSSRSSTEKEQFAKLLNTLSKDESKIPTFNRLISYSTFVYPLYSVQLNTLLEKDTYHLNKVLDLLELKNVNSKSSFLIQDPNEFEKLVDILDKDNMEDFYYATDNLSIEDSISYAKSYTNNVTKLFDKELIDREEELQNRDIRKHQIKEIVQASIDSETGKLSPIAKELIDVIYPQIHEERGLSNKLKQIQNNIKQKSKAFSKITVAIYPNDAIGLINSLKDNKGKFVESNLKDFYKLLRANRKENGYICLNVVTMARIMDSLKDKDGIVDKNKLNIAIKTIKDTHSYEDTAKIVETLDIFPDDKIEVIYETCTSIGKEQERIIYNLASYSKFCFDEKGNLKQENFDYLNKLVNINEARFTSDLFNLLEEKQHLRPFILDIAHFIDPYKGTFSLVNEINNFDNEEKQITDFEKRKMIRYAKANKSLNNFTSFYNACFNNGTFDYETYNKGLRLTKFEHDLFGYNCILTGKNCIDIVKGELPISDIKFKEKVHLLDTLMNLRKLTKAENLDGFEYLDKSISDLENNLSLENVGLPVSNEARREFIKNVLYSTSSKTELTKFEQTIVETIPYFETLTEGLPLSFSREKFLNRLSRICSTNEDIEILKKKTDIIPIIEEINGKQIITGYNGIIKLNDLDLNNPKEKEIYDCMYEFMYNNSIKTNNKELNEELNHILSACPEFINCIGKKQHGTHKYTVDTHSLLVMAYSIQHPNYKSELNALDRSLLKMTAIFHDIMKQEGTVDKGHQNLSSLYTRSISKKIFTSPEIQDRLFDLINNHHWTEEYANAEDKSQKAQELAYRFRRPNDFEISKIIAKSDLKAVNESFYERLKSCLDKENLEPIQNNLNKLYASGNALFTDRIIAKSKLNKHTITKDGKTYHVINLHKIKENEDLGDFGFMNNKTKNDLFFLVHMVEPNSIYSNLNTVKLLTSPMNGGVLSESIITPQYKRTYCDRNYGVILSQINTNIINESEKNQGSGRAKEFNSIMDFVFSEEEQKVRNNFKNSLLKRLNIQIEDVTDEEYTKFYKEVLASKNLISEINKTREYNIGKHTFSGKELHNAIKEYQFSLIDKNGVRHNEIVGYTPKINALVAKAHSFEQLPEEFLRFANENNLPIVIM